MIVEAILTIPAILAGASAGVALKRWRNAILDAELPSPEALAAFEPYPLVRDLWAEQMEEGERRDLAAWLADPTLFWLHPEGPLSDTTPAAWLAAKARQPLAIASMTEVIRHGELHGNAENFRGFTRVPGSVRVEPIVDEDDWVDRMTEDEVDRFLAGAGMAAAR